jgi:hypothetical protein
MMEPGTQQQEEQQGLAEQWANRSRKRHER